MINEEKVVNEEVTEETPNTDVPETEETEASKADAGAEQGEEKTEEPGQQTEEDEALNAKYMRLMADFQNFKRRAEKEKSDIYAYANEKIVLQLLDVIDNFERGLQVECADEGYTKGMNMIFKQFMDVLEKSGLEEVAAQGEDFDPNFHNAVMTEDNDEYESGKVTEVLQKGYLLNKKCIRPSMVKVNN